jgi:hypothetical protein
VLEACKRDDVLEPSDGNVRYEATAVVYRQTYTRQRLYNLLVRVVEAFVGAFRVDVEDAGSAPMREDTDSLEVYRTSALVQQRGKRSVEGWDFVDGDFTQKGKGKV